MAETQELLDVLDRLIEGCNTLDFDSAFGMFLDSPRFKMIGAEGSVCSYRQYIDDNVAYLSGCSSFTVSTISADAEVLSARHAVLTWEYRAVATLKSGESDLFEKAGATFVFELIDGVWKVIRYQESTGGPIRRPAT